MTTIKKAAPKKKAAVKKKAVVKKKAAPKKKFAQAVNDSMPQVKIPEGLDRVDKYEDAESGFILFLSVVILGFAIVGLLWLVTK